MFQEEGVEPTMDEGNADVLARLKGPALAIFMAVARDVEPSPDELQTITGWGRGATYAALRRLAKAGWIARSRRGTWRLTAAGRVAWWELVGGRGAGAGSVPDDGTDIHRGEAAVTDDGTDIHRQWTAVPDGDTDIHRQWTAVPDGDTDGGRSVTRNVTDIHRGEAAMTDSGTDIHREWISVTDYGTGRQRSVTRNGTAQSRGVTRNGTGPPHDHDHDDDQGDDDSNPQIIIKALKAIKFDHPEPWLRRVDRRLVMPWVRYLQQNPGKHRSPAGYLRECVENGDLPHERRSRRRVRDPCPACGRSYWSDTGDCLVCAGVIKC